MNTPRGLVPWGFVFNFKSLTLAKFNLSFWAVRLGLRTGNIFSMLYVAHHTNSEKAAYRKPRLGVAILCVQMVSI